MDLRKYDDVDFGRIDPVSEVPQSLFDFSSGRDESNPLEVRTGGTYLYSGDISTAEVYVRINSIDAPRFLVGPGFAFANIPHGRLYFDWSNQGSGKKCQLLYGVDGRFVPTNDIANIGSVGQLGSITNPLTPNSQSVSHDLIGSIGTTLQTIVAPAANTNGVRIDFAAVEFQNSNSGNGRFMHKSSAPSGITDSGAVTILGACMDTGERGRNLRDGPFLVPAGEGIYFQQSITETAFHSLVHEVL